MNYLIGIDVGTSATKTVLFDENGVVTASSSCEYPLYQPHNGWAEQKPEDWRDAVLKTLKDVVEQSGVQAEDVKGIGISGQMHGLVMLDEAGEVIRPSIIWCDQRTGAQVDEMLSIMPRERWIEITANPPLTGWTAAKILWVREEEPENYSRCEDQNPYRYSCCQSYNNLGSRACHVHRVLHIVHAIWNKQMRILRIAVPAVFPVFIIVYL